MLYTIRYHAGTGGIKGKAHRMARWRVRVMKGMAGGRGPGAGRLSLVRSS